MRVSIPTHFAHSTKPLARWLVWASIALQINLLQKRQVFIFFDIMESSNLDASMTNEEAGQKTREEIALRGMSKHTEESYL